MKRSSFEFERDLDYEIIFGESEEEIEILARKWKKENKKDEEIIENFNKSLILSGSLDIKLKALQNKVSAIYNNDSIKSYVRKKSINLIKIGKKYEL